MTKPPMRSTSIYSGVSKQSSEGSRRLSHERIADDLEAFEKAGGKIEKLGLTTTMRSVALKKTGTPGDGA